MGPGSLLPAVVVEDTAVLVRVEDVEAGGGLPVPGTHWEYHSLAKTQVNPKGQSEPGYPGHSWMGLEIGCLPETQVVGPVQPFPPHWP